MPRHKNAMTYLDFIAAAEREQRYYDAPDITDKMKLASLSLNTEGSGAASFVLDFREKKYMMVSDTCYGVTGYHHNHFLDGGLDAYMSSWHKHDFAIYNKHIFPDLQEILKSHKSNKLRFSRNYRVVGPDGESRNILQRNVFLQDQSGKPIASCGTVTDITDYTTTSNAVQTIEEIDTQTGRTSLLFRKSYFYREEDSIITRREREALLWISEGLSSKQIATKMNVSIHTINNHRKSLLVKTGCTSAAALIRYALKNGLL